MNLMLSTPFNRLIQNKHIINRCIHVLKKRKGYVGQSRSCRWFVTSGALQDTIKLPKDIDLSVFPPENIRNFSIIAHVDHGKSTLADRLLELTGVISASSKNKQVLDRLQVEQERGITVKAQTATLFYTHNGVKYMLNLIDTPGHVDFNYEVSRSLAACQGVILLVDANQGVQAQTMANFFLAFNLDLPIIPVLNKIDLPGAQPEVVLKQLNTVFDIEPETVLQISAKLGTGVEEMLPIIIDRIPPPASSMEKPLKCLMFDSWYNTYRGAVVSIAVMDGCIRKGDKIQTLAAKKTYEVADIGIMHPIETSTNVLYAGQVGYVMANIRNLKECQVGDTISHKDVPVEPMPGFKPAKAMVFSGIFPSDQSQFTGLQSALNKLILNDSSVEVHLDTSGVLGQGYRLGFLGLLHMDVFCTRLDQEFNQPVIMTTPNVPYQVKIKGRKNIKFYGTDAITILNPCLLPAEHMIEHISEPMVNGTILAPDTFIGDIVELCLSRRSTYPDYSYIDNTRVMFKMKIPLSEVLVDFFDMLKSMTSGYASFDYEEAGYQEASLIKLDYLINEVPVNELTMLVHKTHARDQAKHVLEKLKENIPRQLFLIKIQAVVNATVICKEEIKPYRKDVTAKCYGGDLTRKKKLLKAQSEGKKKMRMIGRVEVPRDCFIKVLKK